MPIERRARQEVLPMNLPTSPARHVQPAQEKPKYVGPPYNGFSWDERAATNRPQKIALNSGRIQQAVACSITGFSRPDDLRGAGYTFMHLEDYSNVLDYYPVGKAAHAALHARFRDPERWFRMVTKHYVHGVWWTLLTMDENDMRRPFAEIYPRGLPPHGVLWPDVANELGIGPHCFAPGSPFRSNPWRVAQVRQRSR